MVVKRMPLAIAITTVFHYVKIRTLNVGDKPWDTQKTVVKTISIVGLKKKNITICHDVKCIKEDLKFNCKSDDL